MKFLCRNCKAKYQIADDKVVGRTLRMTCQQCGEPIVVRSGGATSRSSSQVARPLAPMTLAGTGPSALGADFQRQISAPPRDVSVPHEEWHVAINDVPVGPMRRDEVARKIAMNAIDRESLAWREGMDDWLPVKHIPELAGLFPAVPPAAASVTITGVPPAPPIAPPPAAVPMAPAARVDMAPVGGRQLHSLDEYSVPLGESAVAHHQQLPAPGAAAVGGKQLGWSQMFALVSGGALILAAGALLGVRVLAPQPGPAAAPPPAAAVAPAATAAAKAPEPVASRQASVIELDVQPIDGQQSNTTANRRPTGTSTTTTGKKELTAEQKAMLERMGGGLNQGGPSLRSPDEMPSHASGGGQLTAEQLSAVVLRGRKNLQRCYETALRGSGSSDTVRLDVEIEVSPNGNVVSAKANGKGLPGMDDCITRTVKMWRFPSSGEVTQTRFPVVFQPGA